MSKPADLAYLSKENTTLGQALALLESGKMVRISAELSEILADEKNYERIQNASNLEELLEVLSGASKEEKMLRVPCDELLRENFPNLAKRAFL